MFYKIKDALLQMAKHVFLLLQVYHKYKVLATKFLQKVYQNACIKNEHQLYH